MVDQPKFKSVRTDPVSGNEVPIGSTPDEVRDDIPAALSEGEYVVPADVVRYYGVKFFEDLRNEAKSGWSDMEANGRVGGEPMGMEMGGDELPFDVAELQMMDDGEPEGMYEGGYMAGYNQGSYAAPTVPDNMSELQEEFPTSFIGGTSQSGEEYRTYQNAEGMTITIRFINGKPVTPIPAGYTEAGSAAETVAPTPRVRDNSSNVATSTERPEPIAWDTVGADKFNDTIDSMYSKVGKGALSIAGAINPIIGIAGNLMIGHQENKMLEALDKRIESGETELVDTRKRLLSYIDKNNDGKRDNAIEKTGIFGGERGLLTNLKDTDGNEKADFGDTWLGDLLGFDDDGFGIQEGPNLKESLKGARRGKTNNTDSDTDSSSSSSSGGNNVFQSLANAFTPNDGKSYVDGKLQDDE